MLLNGVGMFTNRCMPAQLLQSCLTLCNRVDYSPPGSSVHRILQARVLEWVAMPSSRGYFPPREQTFISCVSCSSIAPNPVESREAPPNSTVPLTSQRHPRSSMRSPAHVEGTQGFLPQWEKDLESPTSKCLEARLCFHGSLEMTRTPSPRTWRPDFPGAIREAP